MFELTSKLFNTLGYIIALAFFFTKFKSAKNIFTKEKHSKQDIFLLSTFFSGLAILGTFVGIDYKGAIVNTRNIGIIVGGMLSGPEVAIISAFVAGIHRLFINFDSVTAIPCAISTILGGFITCFLFKKATNKNRYMFGFIGGVLVESLSMLLILLLTPDKTLAQDIVKNLYLPMVLINGLGISIVIIITEGILEEREKEAGTQAKLALEIANKTLPFFKKGADLNSVCKIVLDSLNAQIVVITDKENILASSCVNDELYIKHEHIQSLATKEVLKDGALLIFDKENEKNDFSFYKKGIKSCIISPLFQDDKVSGTLKIYFDNDEHITARKKYLAIGLSQLISTQLEISKVEDLKTMARDAELKALQNQINPHFLFNALHTTASFVRFDPSRAREIIIDLSTYLRYNLENTERVVPLKKELEQVKAYINIEKARFSSRFNIIYNIDDNISDIKIPSLTIQPLVENSIKHGILKQRDPGTVTISINKKKSFCLVSIEDDGVGIDEEIIKNIDKEIHKCIGLKNVHNRLKLIYGKGLNIERLKKGTKISFEI
ncbi:LytS/YhcK type 5TM receptor domain-containing protein [uncultured Cetobacterium sp.]|uniref:LytS/YhcK type 5TM receptor domain-containing protein n=1 Tax=uncultured Cetobacterium sp. TaxID=527638 RepID=UPI00261070FF|nr:LytS/YhcK type 5TM receptor domain-containing protein [uncultured Cetobacterium sp.]